MLLFWAIHPQTGDTSAKTGFSAIKSRSNFKKSIGQTVVDQGITMSVGPKVNFYHEILSKYPCSPEDES